MNDTSEWISLGDAAQILGVHPATVRNWADRGELPYRRTPGGHRRFRRNDLQQWAASHRSTQPIEAQVIVQSAMGRIRLETDNDQLASFGWYARLDDDAKEAFRAQGRSMMESLIRHMRHDAFTVSSAPSPQTLGQGYADLLQENRLTLPESVQGFLYFNNFLIDAVIQMSETNNPRTPTEWGDMLREVNTFTNQVLLTIIRSYQPQSATSDTPD